MLAPHLQLKKRTSSTRGNPLRRISGMVGAVALASCISTTSNESPVDSPKAVSAQPFEAWSVVQAGVEGQAAIGWVVRFQEEAEASRSFFSVRNIHHQELGLVDTLGRAWKFEPFQTEPNWLGSGSVPDGVSRILSPGSPVSLIESPLFGTPTRL